MKAFTLIELLVTLAISGILAAISVQNFTEYRTHAHRASVRQIVRQLESFAIIVIQELEEISANSGIKIDSITCIKSAARETLTCPDVPSIESLSLDFLSSKLLARPGMIYDVQVTPANPGGYNIVAVDCVHRFLFERTGTYTVEHSQSGDYREFLRSIC